MFQPFSQENPLHTGTGLGLAIVNSIVKSEGIRGKVDVYSTEGMGTEIRVTIETELPSRSSSTRANEKATKPLTRRRIPAAKVFPEAFRATHRGQKLLREVLSSYMTGWWGATAASSCDDANILLVNEDVGTVQGLIQQQQTTWPVVLLASQRGESELSKCVSAFEKIGGQCFVVYKPVRPSHLFKALERALGTLEPSSNGSEARANSLSPLWRPPLTQRPSLFSAEEVAIAARERVTSASGGDGVSTNRDARAPSNQRRHSDEMKLPRHRPIFAHSRTHHVGKFDKLEPNTIHESPERPLSPLEVSWGNRQSGTSTNDSRLIRVLIVEDNHVNRALLAQWLKKQVCILNPSLSILLNSLRRAMILKKQ